MSGEAADPSKAVTAAASPPCRRTSADTCRARRRSAVVAAVALVWSCVALRDARRRREGHQPRGGGNSGPDVAGAGADVGPCGGSRLDENFGLNSSVLFVHVPKAGGTTVQNALRDWSAPHGVPYFHFFPRARNKTGWPKRIGNLPAIYDGHLAWTWYNGSPDLEVANDAAGGGEGGDGSGSGSGGKRRRRPLQIVTLRDPLSQLVSLYDFVLHNPNHAQHGQARRWFGDAALRNVLRDHVLGPDGGGCGDDESGGATRVPDGEEEGPGALLRGMMHSQLNFLCGRKCGWGGSGNGTDLPDYAARLKWAVHNVERCDCVAVTERMDDLIDQLRLHVRWVPPSDEVTGFPRDNGATWKKSVLDEGTRDALRECMVRDYELYERAAAIADRKTEAARRCLSSP